jgi:hypothetical protein
MAFACEEGSTMSIEFFRSEVQRPLDSDGFELPSFDNPFTTVPDDPWEDPRWDLDRWELGPDVPDDAEPSEDDRKWALDNVVAEQDEAWQDYREWAEHVDRLEAIRREHDAEHEARARFG